MDRLIRWACFDYISPSSGLVSDLFPVCAIGAYAFDGVTFGKQPFCNNHAAARHRPDTSRA
jgi:hypothetical protein